MSLKNLAFIWLLSVSTAFAQEKDTLEVNQFLDQWHEAAAKADAQVFFGSIHENGVYIGTDASERWDKPSFWEFSKPHFERGKAWNFKPYDRQLHFGQNGQVAWFSELLDTWMGVCRGSGILTRKAGQWQIMQYHLSVTVPNNQIDGFIELVGAKGK